MSSTSDLPPSPVTWAYVNSAAHEPLALVEARQHGQERDVLTVAPAVGSLLRWIASLTQPAQVLELGTGTGVSTGWLLAGLPAASVVTSVDADPALHSIARRTVAAMDHAAHRCRFIAGDATDVITRLTEGSYALVVLTPSAPALGDPEIMLAEISSVMRPGGVLAMCIDAEHLDRELIAALHAHEAWTTTLATVGSGMCLAVWRPTSSDDGL
ncbi:MAG: methyltransferase domain-containing protein [Candidatus Nanopelagicales bacterium]